METIEHGFPSVLRITYGFLKLIVMETLMILLPSLGGKVIGSEEAKAKESEERLDLLMNRG